MKNKKPFKETRVGKFLTEKAPNLVGNILSIAGDITGVELLKNIGNKIRTSDELSPADKELALKELDLDIQEMQEVTKRWEADMQSDSWLSKNVRPITLLFMLLMLCVGMFSDSFNGGQMIEKQWIENFNIKASWIELIKDVLMIIVIAYFGSRGYEKAKKISKTK